MAAVCVSHSGSYLSDHPAYAKLLSTLGMVATPTFLLLSGTVCGYLAYATRESAENYRRRLIDRGLFLLIVGHLAIGITNAAWAPVSSAMLGSFYITDAVGVGLIVAAFVARRLDSRQLAASGVSLFIAAGLAVIVLNASAGTPGFFERLLLGVGGGDWQAGGYTVPLLPYLALFLLGLAGGSEYAQRTSSGVPVLRLARTCMWIGLTCIALAVCFKLVAVLLKPNLSPSIYSALYFLTDPREKIPPGIGYALAFGGAGVLMASVIFALSQHGRGVRFVSTLAVVGRASLITFVVQFWVYAVPARGLAVGDFGLWWFAAFPASLLLLWSIAAAWDRANYNRFLTIGLRPGKRSRKGVPSRTLTLPSPLRERDSTSKS